jgi:hypothetical protein
LLERGHIHVVLRAIPIIVAIGGSGCRIVIGEIVYQGEGHMWRIGDSNVLHGDPVRDLGNIVHKIGDTK